MAETCSPCFQFSLLVGAMLVFWEVRTCDWIYLANCRVLDISQVNYLRDEAAHFVTLYATCATIVKLCCSWDTRHFVTRNLVFFNKRQSSIVTLIYLENHWLERKVQKVGKTKLVVLSVVLFAQTQMLRNQISVASKTNLNFKLTLVM